MIVTGKTVKPALHDDTVEVNLLDQVDKWVGSIKVVYDQLHATCITV